MNKIDYTDLFKYSLEIGFKALLNGKITVESIKRILCPLDVSRYYELPVVAKNIRLNPGHKILDISSPKLITYYLAKKFPKTTFFGIDKFKKELESWRRMIVPPKNLVLEHGDAVKLKYPNNYFDEVYSISVIEHLGSGKDNADATMMKEVRRILKKGGRFYLTTIVSKNKSVVMKSNKYYSNSKKNKENFFCRIYDMNEIKSRLLTKTKFKLIHNEICNYKFSFYETIFNKLMPLSVLMGWINLIIAPKMIRVQKTTKKILNRAEYFCILEK